MMKLSDVPFQVPSPNRVDVMYDKMTDDSMSALVELKWYFLIL